jgi:antitoxin component of MazEF toxin-antitoxin module
LLEPVNVLKKIDFLFTIFDFSKVVTPSGRSWNRSFGMFSRAKWLILLDRFSSVENIYWRTSTCSPQHYPFSSSLLILWYTIGILKIDLEDFMIAKKLTKVGNTQAVVLDKTLLNLVDADTESTFKVSIEGKKIVLEPMSQKEVDRMALEASDKIRKTQKNVFKKLAK